MSAWQWALCVFAAVAAGGGLMVVCMLLAKPIPALLSNGHGLAGLFAVALLFVINLRHEQATPPGAWWALLIFGSGFVGGLLLFRVLFRNKAPPALVAVHASLGIAGLYVLMRTAL